MNPDKARLRRLASQLPAMNVPRLLERFLALPQVEEARTVMVFYGVGKEPDTTGLIQALLDRGKRVALPVCLPGGQMEARQMVSLDRLSPNGYGIPEPDSACPVIPREDVEVVLVPHLLCDRAGYRLGHGAGFYDRWLAGFSGFSVAVCPRERLVDQLPVESTDIPVTLVLTDK